MSVRAAIRSLLYPTARSVGSLLAAATAYGVLATPSAFAQDTSEPRAGLGLDEVIVTARRREESMQSVPVAITAMSGEALRDAQVQTLEDVRFHAPSFQVSPSPFGSAVPGISIRGQRQLEALITLDPAVGVYFADVVMERPHGTNSLMYDLQSIQVLKGPQGTLFGRNTTGGAVLLSPNKPDFGGFGGSVEVTGGNYDTRNIGASLNLPINDKLALRFAGQWNQHDGYTKNLLDGSHRDDQDDKSFRVGLTFKPTDDIESTTFYQYLKSENNGGSWRLAGVNPASALALAAVGGGANVVSAMQATLALLDDSDWHDVVMDQTQGEEVETHRVTNTTAWTIGGITLKNIAGWHQVNSFSAFDYDGSAVVLNRTAAADNGLPQAPVTVFNSQNDLRVHQWSDEFQVLGNALDDKLQWITGLYYFREKGPDTQTSDLFGRRINDGTGKNTSKSVFAQATYRLPVEGLSLTAGARHTWDDRSIEQRQKLMSLQNPAVPGTGLAYACRLTDPNGPLNPCVRNRSYSDEAPSWNGSLDYAFAANSLVYLTRSRGYKSGGLQLRANSYLEPADFEPEFVDNWELGLKTTFDIAGMPMRINIAAYDQDYTDIQRTVSVLPPGGAALVTTVLNAGEATIKGGELEINFRPIQWLELSGFVNIIEADYKEFEQVGGTAAAPVILDVSDSDFAMIPEKSYGASARFELPLAGELGSLALRGSWYKQTHMEVTDINVVNGVRVGEGQIPGYDTFDASLDWSNVMGQPFDVRAYVRNLTDEEYATGGISVWSSGMYSFNLGAPRTYGLQLRYRFGTENK